MRRSLLLSIALSTVMATATAIVVDQAHSAVNLSIQLPGSGGEYVFQENPRWVAVPGTRVYVVDGNARPDFDVFRYGSYYYVYRGNNWYRARSWNGRYTLVSDRYVPAQFNTLPRGHWKSYPPGWERRNQRANKNWDRKQDGNRKVKGDGRY